MPTISSSTDAIRMYFDDIPRPHFHAYSGGQDAAISIETLEILKEVCLGSFDVGAGVGVRSSCRAAQKWKISEAHGTLRRIEPLT